MTRLLEPVVLAIVLGAATLVASATMQSIVPWWNGRIAGYAKWIVDAHAAMDEPVEASWARRLITSAILAPLVLFVLVGAWPLGILAAVAGGLGPYGWVRYKRSTHLATIDNQLVDALVLMANAMKSGLSLQQAVEMAATESKKPIVVEFERVQKELQLGQSIDHALRSMSERLALPDLEMAVHSIITLRETGGNLSETFMTVANTIVERKKVEGKISAVTAQGVYQGAALCAMPFIMGGVFYLMDPVLMRPMLTTGLGWAIWTVVIVLDALGMWLILKIVRIDV